MSRPPTSPPPSPPPPSPHRRHPHRRRRQPAPGILPTARSPVCRARRRSPGRWSAWRPCASARTRRRSAARTPTPSAPGHRVPPAPAAPTANGQVAVGGSGTANATGGAAGPAERPGDQAEVPTQIPAKGWWQVTRRAFKESSADNVGILAGGVAYAAFLAVFPALIAGISLFGLVADPATIAQQAEGVLAALPETAQPLLRDQIVALTQTPSGALELQPGRLDPARAVERVERHEQPDDGDQHRLRRAGEPQLPQAARHARSCSPSARSSSCC